MIEALFRQVQHDSARRRIGRQVQRRQDDGRAFARQPRIDAGIGHRHFDEAQVVPDREIEKRVLVAGDMSFDSGPRRIGRPRRLRRRSQRRHGLACRSLAGRSRWRRRDRLAERLGRCRQCHTPAGGFPRLRRRCRFRLVLLQRGSRLRRVRPNEARVRRRRPHRRLLPRWPVLERAGGDRRTTHERRKACTRKAAGSPRRAADRPVPLTLVAPMPHSPLPSSFARPGHVRNSAPTRLEPPSSRQQSRALRPDHRLLGNSNLAFPAQGASGTGMSSSAWYTAVSIASSLCRPLSPSKCSRPVPRHNKRRVRASRNTMEKASSGVRYTSMSS